MSQSPITPSDPIEPAGTPDPSVPVSRRRPGRLGRLLALILLPLLLIMVGALAWIAWAHSTGRLLEWGVEQAQRATGGALSIESASGSLLGELKAARITWRDQDLELIVDDARWSFAPLALLQARIKLDPVSARRIEVITAPTDAPASLPTTLHLPVRIDLPDVTVDELVFRTRGQDDAVTLRALQASLHNDRTHWRVDSLALASDFGSVRGSIKLADRPPYALTGQALIETPLLGMPLAIESTLGGTLEALDVDIRTQAYSASLSGRIRLAPLADALVAAVDVKFSDLDLSKLDATLPATRLSGTLVASAPQSVSSSPSSAALQLPPLQGVLSLQNPDSGTIDRNRLPFQSLQTRIRTVNDRIELSELSAVGPPGRLTGQIGLALGDGTQRPGFDVRLATEALDLRAVHPALVNTALRGSVRVRPAGAALAFETDLADRTRGLSLQAQAALNGNMLEVSRARLGVQDGAATFAGTLGIQSPHQVNLSGSIERLDPSRLADLPAGSLTGTWQVRGRVHPDPDADVQLRLTDSRLRGQALSGQLLAHVGPKERISQVDTALKLGATAFRARGDLGAVGDRLRIELESARLQELDTRLSGQLRITAELSNTLRSPGLNATASGQDLKVDALGSARSLKASAQFDALAPVLQALSQAAVIGPQLAGKAPFAPTEAGKDRIAASLAVDGLRIQGSDIESVRGELSGTVARHSLDLKVLAPALKLDSRVKLEGGLVAGARPQWRGDLVEALQSRAPTVRLLSRARLQAGAQGAQLEDLAVEIDGASGAALRIERLGLFDGRLEARGGIEHVPLRWVDSLLAGQGLRASASDPLKLKGRFDVSASLAAAPGQVPSQADMLAALRGGQLRGTVTLGRESGDLSFDVPSGSGAPQAMRAGLQTLDARIDIQGQRIESSLQARGDPLGTINARASSPLTWSSDSLVPDLTVPLTGRLDLSLPSLAFTRALVGETWRIDGALNAALDLGGSLRDPRVSGQISGSKLMAVQRELGMRLTDGELLATVKDNQLDVQSLRFLSGKGSVQMSGSLRPDDRSEAVVSLKQFPIPLGAGQRLVVSGETRAELGAGVLRLRGALKADEGVIEITSGAAPGLSNDVVVVSAPRTEVQRQADARARRDARQASSRAGRGQADRVAGSAVRDDQPEAPDPRGFRIQSNMQIDLGDAFKVFGAGLNARLTGLLELRGRLPDAPRLTGTVRIAEGTYTGFGQNLEIERGTLVFSGAIDNPALDITAYRRFLPVEAGVALTGTARTPRLTLVSKPDVPEADKLSWLVLGMASDPSRGGQDAALQAAAILLESAGNPNASTPSIASTVGLDVLSVRSSQVGSGGSGSTSVQDTVVTLGKRLTRSLFVSYEQSLRGLQNLFRLQYEVTERLSVRARVGTENAVDLVWTRRYD